MQLKIEVKLEVVYNYIYKSRKQGSKLIIFANMDVESFNAFNLFRLLFT